MKLPERYISKMKDLLGESDYSAYEKSLESSPRSGIRINTGKISPGDFEKIAPFEIEKISYMKNGYYINDTDAASKHPYYYAGLYYIQEPSAMIPASCSNITENSYVLDLCAAPGGKSTELLSRKPAFLLSNDISFSRTIPLVKNLDLFGSGSLAVSCETPDKLEKCYFEYFDTILVDAPCSGEGMFRKDSSLIKDWEEKGPEYYSQIQSEILTSAVSMLKDGGELIYSTCTFSTLEDEEIISKLILSDNSLTLEMLPHYDGFSCGFEINDKLDFSKCIRLFPHRFNGEGHFVARIKKNKYSSESIHDCDNSLLKAKGKRNKKGSNVKSVMELNKLPEDVIDFLSHINKEKIYNNFLISNDCIYMVSDEVVNSLYSSIHYTRTGVLVGQLKGGKHFSPHNSIALYLQAEDFDNNLDLPSCNNNVIRYLKGETLILEDGDSNIKKGYVLVCTDGFPLGFAKYDGSKIKNLYTTGWRYNGN